MQPQACAGNALGRIRRTNLREWCRLDPFRRRAVRSSDGSHQLGVPRQHCSVSTGTLRAELFRHKEPGRCKIAVGGSDQPNVQGDSSGSTQSLERLLLQSTQQFGLQIQWNVTHFIQKQSPAVRHFNRPIFCPSAPVKGTVASVGATVSTSPKTRFRDSLLPIISLKASPPAPLSTLSALWLRGRAGHAFSFVF